MCGVLGFYQAKKELLLSDLQPLIEHLLLLSSSRGKDATGLALGLLDQIVIHTAPVAAQNFTKSTDFQKLFKHYTTQRVANFLGHTRLATHGTPYDATNNQPIQGKRFVMAHNGIITNDAEVWDHYHTSGKKPGLDSYTLLTAIESAWDNIGSVELALADVYPRLQGTATIGLMSNFGDSVTIATNFGSLFYTFLSYTGTYVFSSELYILDKLRIKLDGHPTDGKIIQVPAGAGIQFAQNKASKFSLFLPKKTKASSSPKVTKKIITINSSLYLHLPQNKKVLTGVRNSLKKLQKHDFDYDRIKNIPRCTKCILPVTTPFITLDKWGICNYCRNHKPISYQGEKKLDKILKKYRRYDGEPDCIVAFSGGRDSSYGLHYVKTKLKLNPVAFSYDWGMITDLGRRNQARLLGKLGVQHIVEAADIAKKRLHVRKNILAWMKKPDIGIVPLFMEGDKQCEYYAHQLMKKMNIKLIIFCRGNEFEVEEFKFGHTGVKNSDPGGVIHDLALLGKIQLTWYYLKRFLMNPAYINDSLIDTAFGYYSTFVKRYNFTYLWHYIPWDEETITTTLKGEYNWETATDTSTTWRIGDATPPFYNYIYYHYQGFTENDSFRARQVREGVVTRQKALELVNEENKPRYEGLQWYFDHLGLDGDAVLNAIDSMPTLY